MTLLDRVLLARADDQVASRLVYRMDRDEPRKLARVCLHCDGMPATPTAKMCRACAQAGRTATLCRWGCGRYLHRRDQTGTTGVVRNVCGPCRTEHAKERRL